MVATCSPLTGDLACNPDMCPRLRIEPVTLWLAAQCSIHWATAAGVSWILYNSVSLHCFWLRNLFFHVFFHHPTFRSPQQQLGSNPAFLLRFPLKIHLHLDYTSVELLFVMCHRGEKLSPQVPGDRMVPVKYYFNHFYAGFEYLLCHLLGLWSWPFHIISLNFNLLIYEMKIILLCQINVNII